MTVVKARLKFRPDEEIEILGGETELLDLKRQGLVYEGNATTNDGARQAVEREQAAAFAAATGNEKGDI